jgi:hypothetical protein
MYQTYLVPTVPTAVSWTGSVDSNNPGTTSQTYKDVALQRINWFRAMAGVPAVITFNSTYSAKNQKAALIFSANNALSHYPPSSWKDWSQDGYDAAGSSNICAGSSYPQEMLSQDPGCIEGYITDDGSNNTAVGHRRWLLVPQTLYMGTGDVTQYPLSSYSPTYESANAVWVMDGHYGDTRPATRDTFVAWPPKGYVPYQVMPGRWSVSYASANFTNANVTMTVNGSSISLTKLAVQPASGYIGENTLAWEPSTDLTTAPSSDRTVNVTVTGVTGYPGGSTISYTVIIFDPSQGTTLSAPTLSSPANGATGVATSGATLSWSAVSGATSYDLYAGSSNPPSYVGNVTSTSSSLSGMASGTTYYWYVVAKNTSATSAASSTWSFTTQGSAPAAPSLSSPANGATSVSTSAALAWSSASGATSYDVYFGTSSSPSYVTNTGSLTYSPGMTNGTTYYWKIVARNSTGTTSSSTWSFTTVAAASGPGAPTLSSPSNGATGVATTVTLSWSAGSGATSHMLYFGTTNPPPALDYAGTSYTVGNLSSGTTYYWYVLARNASGTAASATRSFTTAQSTSLSAPSLTSPGNGATGVSPSASLNWSAATGALSYDVYFGSTNPPPLANNTTGLTYSPSGLVMGSTYYWKVIAKGAYATASSSVWSFTVVSSSATGLLFVPVTPCRVIDTRSGQGTTGSFGPPVMSAGTSRSFPIPQGRCNIPSTAKAYSVNTTVVPSGNLGYLTMWPTGQSQPLVSTLNAPKGGIVANAAIVPAGTSGSISAYVTDQTELIVDISGYYDSSNPASSYAFYPATPCRVADTRNPTGTFGGPTPSAGSSRSFPIPSSACSITSAAQAYSTNVTVVPQGPLGYLTLWPTGQSQPLVSTLNSPGGNIVANAAIVPSGTNGGVSAFVTNTSDIILDINGYFAAAGYSGALVFYPVSPCRVIDTRNATGTFGGPVLNGGSSRAIPVPSSACNIPSSAQAYSMNVTVVPQEALGYLTIWPTGVSQPLVSTLNSDSRIVANAAIVPAGTSGSISVYVTNKTHLIVDINGYFAP